MGEGIPCRELVMEMIKDGEKSRKGKTVVCETTQGLSKAGSCCHPQGWRTSGRGRLHLRVHPQEQSPEPSCCQNGDHRAHVNSVDSPCLSCLWLCGATCIVFTCFWLSTCRPHRKPMVCSQIHETTALYLLYMETHTGYLTFPDGFSCLNIVELPPV